MPHQLIILRVSTRFIFMGSTFSVPAAAKMAEWKGCVGGEIDGVWGTVYTVWEKVK